MGFYTVLYRVNALFQQRGWKLNHCRRSGPGVLRYFITNELGTVLAPAVGSGRRGLTLAQLLQWLAQQPDIELTAFAAHCEPLDPQNELPLFETLDSETHMTPPVSAV